MRKENWLDRREFMKLATWAIGGLISVGMSIPAIAYIITPALRNTRSKNLVQLAPPDKVELGTPTLFKVKIKQQAGWILNENELAVYVLSEDGRNFIAMSNICTHLGCRVRWVADQNQFYCPCHNGVFAKDGSVISGPPPRPLDRYGVEIQDGHIFIVVS